MECQAASTDPRITWPEKIGSLVRYLEKKTKIYLEKMENMWKVREKMEDMWKSAHDNICMFRILWKLWKMFSQYENSGRDLRP